MATKLQKAKWKLYLEKKKLLYLYGINRGLINTYENELIENLRNVYYGGVPASILLLSHKLCNGYCYDRALLLTLGFNNDDDFKMILADINEITLNPDIIDKTSNKNNGSLPKHYGNHCFVERIKKDGTTLVYDTSTGLVYEKNLYYRLQNPIITKINSKKNIQNYIEYQDIKNNNFEKDIDILPSVLPLIEELIKYDLDLYTETLQKEISLFKQKIDYDNLCQKLKEEKEKFLWKQKKKN